LLETQEIVKFLASFSIIVIILYSLYYFLAKSGFSISSKGKRIEIVDTKSVGRNRGFLIVKVDDREYFFTVDEKGMKKIDQWPLVTENESDDNDG